MYPHVTQFQTRRQALAREHHAIRQSDRAGRDSTRPAPAHRSPALQARASHMGRRLRAHHPDPRLARTRDGLVAARLRTLVLSVTMVVALTWFVMPRLTSIFRVWLSPSA